MVESEKQLSKVGYDDETGMYWAEVLHLCEIETFHAESVDELRWLIQASVINRQEDSERSDANDMEPFFESLVLCLDPALHLELSQQAGLVGKNLNEYIVDILEEVVNRSRFPELA